jgi:hypothetical protein
MAYNKIVNGSFKSSKAEVKLTVPVFMFEEGTIHIVYCPLLDLSGYGNTEDEAKESFRVTLDEFLRYTTNKNTLHDELVRLGWHIKKKTWIAPDLEELIKDEDNPLSIVYKENKKVVRYEEEVLIPA